ncbi:MAG: stage IV sporulation protein A, partial [Firmicutes bacterium]|nr:stage IV sporulation protein A [Bacillota bacterium]
TGYGIVMPAPEEMTLDVPEIIHKGGSYGVRLKAGAPSIHMMRADIVTELSPMVGDEKQSEDLLNYLLSEYEGNTEKLWESNIFGKSLYELVSEGLNTKLTKMPEDSRFKIKDALTKIVNEGGNGLICLIV